MTSMQWIHKGFHELSPSELYQILALRSAIFVLEQTCLYQDMDNLDQDCIHLMGIDSANKQLAAYARMVPPGVSFPELSIGRIIIAQAYRGRGMGIELVQRSINLCRELYEPQAIRIGAQAHLQSFYGSLGFIPDGEVYDEDGIDHIEMVLPPTSPHS